MTNIEIQWAIPALLVVMGWIAVHHFSALRDVATRRRLIVTEHLINALRVLAGEISHREPTPERREKLIGVLTDIQIFGSSEQISLAQNLITDVVEQEEFQLDSLINSLRRTLRRELKLEPASGNIMWLRWKESKE